jgi:heme-degrading monooxygenase HmoA
MIEIHWRFTVKPEHRAAFETTYASDGAWAVLFARADGYLGTELLHDEDGTYRTIDRWRAQEDFDAFKTAYREEYEALDRSTEGWTLAEERMEALR